MRSTTEWYYELAATPRSLQYWTLWLAPWLFKKTSGSLVSEDFRSHSVGKSWAASIECHSWVFLQSSSTLQMSCVFVPRLLSGGTVPSPSKCLVSGCPAHAFNSWLLSHGWARAAEWKCNHGDTGLRLDLTTVGDAGQRQHVVRDAWRAWCLRRHMAWDRRDTQLDCFIVSMLVGIFGVLTGRLQDCLLHRARLLVRWFAVLLFRQLLSVVGSQFTLPPLAFGTIAPNSARLIMLLGNVSIGLVLSLNLLSFCLLGMVGLWRIRMLTLLWCKVGWLRLQQSIWTSVYHE